MNDEEKSQLTGWIVVGVIVAVLAVGIFYANQNTPTDLSNISPAAGEFNDTSKDTGKEIYGPAKPD